MGEAFRSGKKTLIFTGTEGNEGRLPMEDNPIPFAQCPDAKAKSYGLSYSP
jgi:hypothetical protein